jgi:hypothetical protein
MGMVDDEITDAAHNCPPELAHSPCTSDNKCGVLSLSDLYNSMAWLVGIFYSEFSLDLSTKSTLLHSCVLLIDSMSFVFFFPFLPFEINEIHTIWYTCQKQMSHSIYIRNIDNVDFN